MAQGRAKLNTKRIGLSLADGAHDYLEMLAATGLYGKTPTEVASSFVTQGIERAVIKDEALRKYADLVKSGAVGGKKRSRK